MVKSDIVVIGAGPAGLSAAVAAGRLGAGVLVFERDPNPGGQLIKQTHRFFGSEREGAGIRGFRIGQRLAEEIHSLPSVTIVPGTTVIGLYPDGRLLVDRDGKVDVVEGARYVFATGAAERGLLFENNDLPGVYGAGAAQTLMNVHGVAPGNRVLMVGSGNIGLIVSYQLLQAGIEVAAVVEGAGTIGGYLVHAAKIRRAGVPVLTAHSVAAASGTDRVEGGIICRVDGSFRELSGSRREIDCDVICLAVGLTPLCDSLWQAGCRMTHIPALGGHVPWHDGYQRTSSERVFVAGDAGGVEEASSAMLTGELAGITAAHDLGYGSGSWGTLAQRAQEALARLRSGPAGAKIRSGLAALEASVKGGPGDGSDG